MPAYQLLQDGRLSDQSVKTLLQFGISPKNASSEVMEFQILLAPTCEGFIRIDAYVIF